jgi:pyrroloquinoline quinone biosynthesis protein D
MSTALVKCPDRFIETEIDDEAVLMDLDSGDFFSLAGTALAIWQRLDGARGRDAIVAELAAAYDAEPAQIADDFDAFTADLKALGILA